jgi:hypothetical protein
MSRQTVFSMESPSPHSKSHLKTYGNTRQDEGGNVPSNYLPSLHGAKANRREGGKRTALRFTLPSIFPSSSLNNRRKQSEYEGVDSVCFIKEEEEEEETRRSDLDENCDESGYVSSPCMAARLKGDKARKGGGIAGAFCCSSICWSTQDADADASREESYFAALARSKLNCETSVSARGFPWVDAW